MKVPTPFVVEKPINYYMKVPFQFTKNFPCDEGFVGPCLMKPHELSVDHGILGSLNPPEVQKKCKKMGPKMERKNMFRLVKGRLVACLGHF